MLDFKPDEVLQKSLIDGRCDRSMRKMKTVDQRWREVQILLLTLAANVTRNLSQLTVTYADKVTLATAMVK